MLKFVHNTCVKLRTSYKNITKNLILAEHFLKRHPSPLLVLSKVDKDNVNPLIEKCQNQAIE